jgi:8-oxo-dGTP diphosphatase
MAYAGVVDVMLLLTHDDRVLLALRQGASYADGLWNVLSETLEEGEHALDAIVREAQKEIGITSPP